MPALRDPRRERFAQAIANRKPAAEAHLIAGYSKSTQRNVFRMLKRADVVLRIEEINAERLDIERRALAAARERYDVTTDRVVAELARIGFANMQDYVTQDSNGEPHFDYAKISRDQASAISEITIDQYVEGRGDDARQVKRIRFKLHDKRAALVDLGRHLGLFIDPSVLNVNVANFFTEQPPSMAEWRREIAADRPTLDLPSSTGGMTGGLQPGRTQKRNKINSLQ